MNPRDVLFMGQQDCSQRRSKMMKGRDGLLFVFDSEPVIGDAENHL